MQKYIRILLIAFITLLFCESSYADKLLAIPVNKSDDFKEVIEKLENDKKLMSEFKKDMLELNKSLEEKILYEQMLEIINNVSQSNLSDYLKYDNIMQYLDDFRKEVKSIAVKGNVDQKVVYNSLLDFYKDSYKKQIIEILRHYSQLSKLYDRVFSANKEKGKSIRIMPSKEDFSLNYVGNMLIDELKVLIPSKEIDTPFDLTVHLDNALYNNSDYVGILMKAYTMIIIHDGMILKNKNRGVAIQENYGVVASLVMAGIQSYKIMLETDSKVIAFAKYGEELEKLMKIGNGKTDMVTKSYNTKIKNLEEKIKSAEGLVKERKSDELVWLIHQRDKKVKELNKKFKKTKATGKYDYGIAHEKILKAKSEIRKGLMNIYWDIWDQINQDAPDPESLEKLLVFYERFATIFSDIAQSSKQTPDGTKLKGGR